MLQPVLLGTISAAVAAAFLLFRALRSQNPVRQAHFRGRRMRGPEEVTPLLAKLRPPGDPGLRIGRQLFPSETGPRHFAFIGTTGSGKTLLQRLLMQSALSQLGCGRNQRAVVYDAKQDAVSILSGLRLATPIHILNPLDSRSISWNMAADIDSPAAALQVATTLIPESKGDSNPFFTSAARHLLHGAVLALIERAPGRWKFRHPLLLLRDPERLKKLLASCENTRHLLHYFAHPATAQNIVATILTYTSPYEIIAACWDRSSDSLSLKDWLRQESVLVLGNDEENRAAIDTINRLLFRRLAELTLAQPEVDDRSPFPRRTWFFLDEVREAGKMELLGRLLNKGRSKGVAVSLGFQDIAGMREANGPEIADELVGQCNTKIVLRLNSPESAAWVAKLFGTREVLESRLGESRNRQLRLNRESSSGESFSYAIAPQPLVLDSEIMGLPDTSRTNGLTAFFINPATGPFGDNISSAWLSQNLTPPDRSVENYRPRPVSDQYLRPWDDRDDALLGFARETFVPEEESQPKGESCSL